MGGLRWGEGQISNSSLGLVGFSILLFLLILLILEYNGKKKGRKSSIIIPKA